MPTLDQIDMDLGVGMACKSSVANLALFLGKLQRFYGAIFIVSTIPTIQPRMRSREDGGFDETLDVVGYGGESSGE